MKKYVVWIYLFVVTLLLQPWRNFFCQDDGAYAYSALNWSKGVVQNHSANLSFLLPQISLGAVFIKIFSFIDSLRALNLLTWIFFCVLVLIFDRLTKKEEQSKIILLSFFSFPLWWQYGASYLVEIYSCVFIVGYLLCCDRSKNWGIFVFAFLLGSQIQSLVALPVMAAIFFKVAGLRLPALLSMTGAALSMGVYYFFPHTPYQEGYGYWIVQNWLRFGALEVVLRYSFQLVQAICALGLFFIPLVGLFDFKKLFSKNIKVFWCVLAAQVIFVGIGIGFEMPVMGGGVLFFDYLPMRIGHLLLSFGVWGFVQLVAWFKALKWQPLERSFFSFTAILICFSAFRFANDVRVVMTLVIGVYYFLTTRKLITPNNLRGRGQLVVLLAAVFLVALVSNLYNLNTNEARWNTARQYEAEGIPKTQISAGVGYNLFYLESQCVDNLVQKIQTRPYWKSPSFYSWVISQVNRSYAMGWTPQVEIKPASFFMWPIKKTLPNGSHWSVTDEKTSSYQVLGFQQFLRVVKYAQPKVGACFDGTL